MRWFVGILFLLLLPGVTASLAQQLVLLAHAPHLVIPLLAGTFLGMLFDQFVLRRASVLQTFEHELTHAVVALLFFRRVTGFVVKRSGGAMAHQGGLGGRFGTDCIGLAPYLLPLFTAVSVLARRCVPPAWFPWYDLWIGLTFGYHLWSTMDEIRGSWTKKKFVSAGSGEVTQTDIARRGYVYSTIFIATSSVAIHGVLVAYLLGGVAGLKNWAWEVWSVTGLMSLRLGVWGTMAVGWVSGKLTR